MSKHRVVAKAQKKGRRNRHRAWKQAMELFEAGLSAEDLRLRAIERAKADGLND